MPHSQHWYGMRRWCGLSLVAAAILGLLLIPGTPPAVAATLTLYDGALGGTPDTQRHFVYLAQPFPPDLAASQGFANGATTLTTTLQITDTAGYFAFSLPQLDRTTGYRVRFTAQVVEEIHKNKNRAGFSVIALSSDNKGIELGFWQDQVWAQSGPQFTRAETATLDTTAGLIDYELTINRNSYMLTGGAATLSGPLRDYSSSNTFPYTLSNFMFLGDDTTSASARIRLAKVDVVTAEPPTATAMSLYLPAVMRPTAGAAAR